MRRKAKNLLSILNFLEVYPQKTFEELSKHPVTVEIKQDSVIFPQELLDFLISYDITKEEFLQMLLDDFVKGMSKDEKGYNYYRTLSPKIVV